MFRFVLDAIAWSKRCVQLSVDISFALKTSGGITEVHGLMKQGLQEVAAGLPPTAPAACVVIVIVVALAFTLARRCGGFRRGHRKAAVKLSKTAGGSHYHADHCRYVANLEPEQLIVGELGSQCMDTPLIRASLHSDCTSHLFTKGS